MARYLFKCKVGGLVELFHSESDSWHLQVKYLRLNFIVEAVTQLLSIKIVRLSFIS